MRKLIQLVLSVVAFALFSATMYAASPKGWFIAGDQPDKYDSGLDVSGMHNDHPSAYLRSKSSRINGFGTLMQEFRADHYQGRRVRFSAFVKSSEADRAGLWMRIDKGPESVAFDNMQSRPIKGTSDWKKYNVVLDVPQDASGIFFGILLSGSGEVWLSDARIEIVNDGVPITGGQLRSDATEPTNLDFEEK
ncbi:MAG TPA: hypothetical protein VFA85_17990 [Terriglobales bacterium]|nr:hypothetical protein [Terriglobales bacterium]